ncbi:MAG: hypothetical protein ACKPKO_60815, partial [Candidatus Fonsibacter sp.]
MSCGQASRGTGEARRLDELAHCAVVSLCCQRRLLDEVLGVHYHEMLRAEKPRNGFHPTNAVALTEIWEWDASALPAVKIWSVYVDGGCPAGGNTWG